MDLTPPKALLRPLGRAIADYRMIRDGDRILLGLSGGKDSLSLLHLLRHLQRHAPVHFELAALTVDPMVEGFDPSTLAPHLAALGIPFHYQREPIMERARDHMQKDSYCSWCARMKRGTMYTTARRHGYNVLALGQHLDDLAESFLMSAFHGGRLQTMKACYTNDAGDVRIIRPLVYVRERQLAAFAGERGLPVIKDNCPACFRMPTQRAHMKALLAGEEESNPGLFKALLSTMRPLMAEESAKIINDFPLFPGKPRSRKKGRGKREEKLQSGDHEQESA
ncbi:ATP-binding protein [Thiohalobacter sp. IOR34]|uniref:tRNA 2-thiocytidine biosynthesis TtcA family protein n=1 Tax=Thiohalobacter sp. IOR34 TaxID=3057176 RepID=UPI0025B12178|nr:ATP-binding protein [Thiohalobacter sp. IOR34]WJW75631.1 ATP-binding protein [Thiohalobacter sp. IOR34]